MDLDFYKYRLPFVHPLQTSRQTFESREGIILKYQTKYFQCYGEAAPLPGYSNETLAEIEELIIDSKKTVTDKLKSKNPVNLLLDFYADQEWPPSLQFGIDALAYQVEAYRLGQTLQYYLFSEVPGSLPVNTLGSLQSDSLIEETNQQITNGFQTIKFKVGMDFELELAQLQKVRTHFPDLTVRIDANQAWSLETAIKHCKKLESLNIEYCEEPLEETKPENFELLSNQTSLPLALDESLTRVSYWPNLLPFTSHIILKPMLIGNFSRIFETQRLANTHDNKAVYTTSLESGIGRAITAILASGSGAPKTAHGLATGQLLARDVQSDIAYLSDGLYHLKNEQFGQGINDHEIDNISSSLF